KSFAHFAAAGFVNPERLKFEPETRGALDRCCLQMSLSSLGDRAPIAGAPSTSRQIPDVANHHKRRGTGKGIEKGRFRIRNDKRVSLLNVPAPRDCRSVKSAGALKGLQVQGGR